MDLRNAARDPWVWGQIALVAAVFAGVPIIAPGIARGDGGGELRWVGIMLLGFGLIRAVLALLALGESLTPGTEPLPGAELVTTGPYEHVRHPIYAALILVLAGYALLWRNWLPGALVFTLATLYFEAKARREERWLRARFPEYETYARRASRLFPGLG